MERVGGGGGSGGGLVVCERWIEERGKVGIRKFLVL